MSNYRTRNSRERRLRARYRRKIWTCGIVMLIIGLVLGYVLCMMFPVDKPSFLTSAAATPTPAPMITVTEAPTAEPTAEPTAVPTAEPTATPTAEPTAVPTATPTAEPTAAPTAEANIEPAIVFNSLDKIAATATPTAEPTATPTAEPTATPTAVPTVAPTAEPTATPTPEPTATPEPSPEPTPEPVIVPFGESCTFDTQITSTGSARLVADDAAYETLNLTLRVDAYKDPAYFEATYSDTYNLQGNEAAIMFDLTLNGYTGTTEIIPQNFLLITCCGEDASVTAQSFQLMDSEIAGKTNIAITSDVTSTLYKRYDYNADQGDMVYMVVTTYNDGKAATYWFEMQGPEEEPVAEAETETTAPAETATTTETSDSGIDPNIWLTVGSRGEEVKKLQAKLIELGLLTGSPDGQYGKYTASAVQIMQKKFGMEQTGVATASFLEKLYSGE